MTEKQVKAEIIAVGTELLLGQIVNSNAQWLSEKLALIGANIYQHSVAGDNYERLKTLFSQADQRSNLIVVTGGLGPTDDDLTREAASEILGKSLYEDEKTMEQIKSYYDANHLTMTENNRKQARIFEGAEILLNEVGMAPGMAVKKNDTLWVFLPGVPREMKSIMEQHGFPFIQNHFSLHDTIQSKMLRFIGIGESQLESDLRELINEQSNPTIAPLASDGEVALRLTASAKSKEEADHLINETEQRIMKQVGKYCYGYDKDTIETKVFNLLKEKGLTISSAESLTGGQFVERIVSQSGASSICNGGIVCYSSQVKQQLLQVPKLILNQYGTVSKECAQSLAVNVAEKLDTSIGISFTGVAGPDEHEGHPAGTVFIGIYQNNELPFAKKFHFNGDRSSVRSKSVKKGFELLYNFLKK